ncbi:MULTISPECIES: hypothetical protein [Rhodovulum]|uniref:hypothetical protein n=1 Tax=Rhodovulum TaxID=34008 RepID=UPI0014032B4F|nr:MULTISPECIES: hypothetical protein [Rhodovulum]
MADQPGRPPRDARADFALASIGLVAVKAGLLPALVLAPWTGALLAYVCRRMGQ